MNRNPILVVSVGLLIAFACGCGTQRAYDYRYFVLSVDHEAAGATTRADILKIRNFRISDRYNRTELTYRTGEMSIETDYYRRYIVPPESLVTEETRRWLQAGHLFSQVLDATSRATAQFSLEGNVSALYGDFRPELAPGSYKAVVEIQFVLIDERKADNTVVFHQSYRSEQPVARPATDELIKGQNLALKDILTRMEADLKKTLAAPVSAAK
jgi:cholesterol transport system auxiliary component